MRLLISVILLMHLQLYSQGTIQPIEPGQKVPPGILDHYKGKWVILDFWGTYCAPCIASLPKMDSLQKQFNSNLQIILVTKNSASSVESLFGKIKTKKPSLVSFTGDTVLSRLFPYASVPHHVWIDTSGYVRYVTDGYNTNFENVNQVLSGNKIDVDHKKEIVDFNKDVSMLVEGNGRQIPNLLYYSAFFKYISNYGRSGIQITCDTLNGTSGIKMINLSLLSIYQIAFSNSISPEEFNNDNRISLEVEDKTRFLWPLLSTGLRSWKPRNLHCYESRMPLFDKHDLYKVLRNDLEVYFPFEAYIENRKTKCFVLRKVSENLKVQSKGGIPLYKSSLEGGLHIRNQPLKTTLFLALKAYNSSLPTPFIDSTCYSGNIDIDLKSKLTDLKEVRKELRKYNLDIVEREISIPMLVIKDRIDGAKL